MKWMCVKCGQEFDSYSKAERHIDLSHKGGRIRIKQPELSKARQVAETDPL